VAQGGAKCTINFTPLADSSPRYFFIYVLDLVRVAEVHAAIVLLVRRVRRDSCACHRLREVA